MRWLPRLLLLALVLCVGPVAGWSSAQAAAPLAAMSAPVFQRVNPTTQASLVTPWPEESAAAAATYGFTVDLGTLFVAALSPTAGLTGVHRLFHPSTGDFRWALDGSPDLASAMGAGYQDEGTDFYAAGTPIGTATAPVESYVKGTMHRLALTPAGDELVAAGWRREGTAFHVPAAGAPPSPSTTEAGAAAIGSTAYSAPAGAVYVAPNGADGAAGSADAPLRTLAEALAVAPPRGTVVLRGGTYHESVEIADKPVVIQSYPQEQVWLDGSEPVTGWTQDAGAWRKDGWTQRFDHSPTYTQGAPDLTEPDWQFVNPRTYPMAAHPDQVFVDGVGLRQVQSRHLVTSGTFYLDESTSQLYIGTNPFGHTVEASTLVKALSIRQPEVTLRGIGIRRYAPSVFHMGTVTVEAPRVHLENVDIADSATTGLSVTGTDCVLHAVTVERSGMLGIHTDHADRIVFSSVLSTQNNAEHFNIAPVSGGAKLGRTRGVSVANSSFSGNYGHGFWEDESEYDTVIRSSQFNNNDGNGIFLEISAKAVVGDNLIAGNKQEGVKVNNTSDVQLWNNTFVGNARALWLAQDSRRNNDPSNPALDDRIPWPDPDMPWTLGPVTVRNNVFAQSSSSATCLLCVEDYSDQDSADEMGVTANGDVYQRSSATSPKWLVVWAGRAGSPSVYPTLSGFVAASGQEKQGREYTGSAIVDSKGVLSDAISALAGEVAVALPSDVAATLERAPGSRHLGRW